MKSKCKNCQYNTAGMSYNCKNCPVHLKVLAGANIQSEFEKNKK